MATLEEIYDKAKIYLVQKRTLKKRDRIISKGESFADFVLSGWPILTTHGKRKKELEDAFKIADKYAYEEGVMDGLNAKAEMTGEIDAETYKKFIEFMVKHNIECCYHDKHGFMVRKRNYQASPAITYENVLYKV